jgi:hypothetical protein
MIEVPPKRQTNAGDGEILLNVTNGRVLEGCNDKLLETDMTEEEV